MPNLLTHLLLALRNRANIALLTLTVLMAILAPTPASAQTTPTFGTATVPDTTYTVNVAVSDTLPAAGTGALTYTLTPALPAGLTYKAATSGHGGIIAGAPTTAASATTYTLTATDASNATATLTFTISVTAIVTIPDDSLRAVIESSLGKSAGETITNVDMSRLTRLVAPSKGITDLTGLAFATNLTDLRLHNNKIRDISALSGLTSLHSLRLHRNRISDLSPLVRNTGWSRGAFVNVRGNPLSAASRTTHIPTLTGIDRGVTVEFDQITLRSVTIPDASLRAVIEDSLNLSIAAGDAITNADMLGLFQLVAENKGIRDLTGLEFATNLDTLDLRNNNITAIDSLSGLINLASLGLRNNLISDLSPLTSNTGLGRGDHVAVRGNPLSAASRTTHIPDLTRRRVSVTFDSRSWAPLELVSGDGQTGRAGEVLRDSFVVQVRSATDTTYAYRNLPVTFSVAADKGSLSATSAMTDSNGLAHTRLTLGANVGTDTVTVKAFVEGVDDTLTFTISVALSSDATLSRLTFYSVEQAASGAGGVGGQAGSSDATLGDIKINNRADPVSSDSDTIKFTLGAEETLLTVKPTTRDTAATYTITPADARSRPAGHQVNLDPGSNTITIIVTAADRITTKTYTIIVTRRKPIDYDDDDDDLIDVKTLAQLNAIRYDLDGDGKADNPDDYNAYAEAFPDIGTSLGCRTSCTGYELRADLDFDKNGDGSITAADSTAFFAIGATDSSGFVPIGRNAEEFEATFRGNGHTISHIVINRSATTTGVGLFNNVKENGHIEGVGLIDAKVTGNAYVGALVASNYGTVVNCYVTETVSGNSTVSGNRAVGGLVGHNYRAGRVIASYSTASVTGAQGVGALMGSNSGAIQASYAIGKVVSGSPTQGLVGGSNGSITHSYYDSETTGVNGTYAKTTAQLQAPTSYFSTLGNGADTIYAAWNVNVDSTFTNPYNNTPDDPWNFGESNQYPVLKLGNYDTAAQFAAQPDKAPTFGTATIRDTTYLVARAVSDTLPAATATSGNGKLTYALTPNLPAGLTFDNMTRVIAGTPTAAASASTYTLTVSDADTITATHDTDSLTFTIAATVVVSIPDASLRAVITDSLGKARNASINNAEMLHLTRLDAPNKGIRNLTGLEFATNLDTLDLRNNNITAIDSLSGLDSLKTLWLRNNLISDLEPLALNTGLGSGDLVDVRGNPLSAASRTTHIDTLTIRGVTVRYDTLSVAELVKVSGDGQIGTAGEALAYSFVVRVQRKNPASYPYRNLPVTFSVAADGGRLSATSDTTDSDGLAHT